jgi:PAS domain S-box-containing protein
LNDSEQGFSILYDPSKVPTLTWTRKGGDFELTDFNDAARAVLPALVTGWRDGLPTDYVRGNPDVVDLLRAALRAERSVTTETEAMHLCRESRMVLEITCSPLSAHQIAMHVVDLSDDRVSRAHLREKEQHYRSIFENAVEGLFSSTVDGRFIEMNQSHAKLFGYESPAQFMAEVHDSATAWADPGQRLQLLERLASERTVRNFEYRAFKRDGSMIWVSMDAHAITDECGHLIGLQGMEIDITSVKQAQIERKDLVARLVRGQGLQSVGEMASGLAHDFNNLLMIIATCTDFLARDVDKRHRSDLAQIAAAADKGRAIVKQLLSLVREERLEPSTVDLNDVTEGMRALLGIALGPNFTMVTELAPDLWPTKADAGQMGQVLVNLVVNARDAMPRGGPIEIRTRNLSLPIRSSTCSVAGEVGDYVALTVRDRGVGMTDDVKEHLFDPFFTTKPPEAGTGLGLSIVKTIVERFGGRVSASSTPPVGTEVRILLPRSAEPR